MKIRNLEQRIRALIALTIEAGVRYKEENSTFNESQYRAFLEALCCFANPKHLPIQVVEYIIKQKIDVVATPAFLEEEDKLLQLQDDIFATL